MTLGGVTGCQADRVAKDLRTPTKPSITSKWSERGAGNDPGSDTHGLRLVISAMTDMLWVAMTDLVLLAKALADPTRVRILSALRGRELCVCELCDALEASQSTLSTHLQVIRDAGLVRTRRKGKWIYYAPAPEKETLTEVIFGFFTPTIRRDARIQRDTERVKKRLAERNGDDCCRGFEQECCPRRKRK